MGRALPRVHFNILNTINASTGYTGFQLKTGHSPCLIPPLLPLIPDANEVNNVECALAVLKCLDDDIGDACDNLLRAKVSQAQQSNRHHRSEVVYKVGDLVMLSSMHHRRDYLQKGRNRVAKFMPRYDGPYKVTHAFPECSVYTLEMPNAPDVYPTFHSSLLTKHHANDHTLFPSRTRVHPGTIVTEDGEVEFWVDSIIDERK